MSEPESPKTAPSVAAASNSEERIGAYRVERRLGRGGMGEVFLGYDDRLDRRVAIKRIRHDSGTMPLQHARFRREARAAARLGHPACISIRANLGRASTRSTCSS